MKPIHLAIIIALAASVTLNAWQFAQKKKSPDPATPAPKSATGTSTAPETGGKETGPDTKKSETPQEIAPRDLAAIMGIRNPMERFQALIEHVKNLPSDEIGGMLKELRAGAGKLDTEAKFIAHLLLTRWGQEDPDAAFASLADIPAKQAGGEAMAILASLAANDPARAVAWLSDPENSIARQPFMGHLLALSLATEWSRHDPDAALAWAAELPSGQRAGAYSGIIGNIVETDPERAAAVALELDSGARSKVIGQIARNWAEQSPERAIEWAGTLEGYDRSQALSDALASWATTAPESAAAYVDGLAEDERSDYVGGLARNWAQQAPAEAAEWLGSQPESEGKSGAMGHVMWQWTHNDPEAASSWLTEQPHGDSYDHGVTGLAKAATHAFDDPEAGVTWASTIEDEQLRTRMTRHTLEQ